MSQESISLQTLNLIIKETLKEHTRYNYWIVAEINELKVNYSGHCYLELVEKDPDSEKIKAKNRATIWAPNYRLIKPYFETTTGQPLVAGLSVMVRVSVEFHELYGLSLNITDIEPTYTVGELAIQKQKVIDKLTEEGVIDMNKELDLPLPCNKIAVISSSTAAGYGDFADQLLNNPYGYKFYLRLFPAIMQGNQAEQSIIQAFEEIYEYEEIFDVVVLIRGGGSQTDLSCFNNYWLSYHISQFPKPVFTGIGHEQDDSVADIVAHTRLKTPTAVAAYLIDNMAALDEELTEIQSEIFSLVQDFMGEVNQKLIELSNSVRYQTKELVNSHGRKLERFENQLAMAAKGRISGHKNLMQKLTNQLSSLSKDVVRNQQHEMALKKNGMIQNLKHLLKNQSQQLENYEARASYLDPKTILARGYSITLQEGKAVRDAGKVKPGKEIETILYKGKIRSTVTKK